MNIKKYTIIINKILQAYEKKNKSLIVNICSQNVTILKIFKYYNIISHFHKITINNSALLEPNKKKKENTNMFFIQLKYKNLDCFNKVTFFKKIHFFKNKKNKPFVSYKNMKIYINKIDLFLTNNLHILSNIKCIQTKQQGWPLCSIYF